MLHASGASLAGPRDAAAIGTAKALGFEGTDGLPPGHAGEAPRPVSIGLMPDIDPQKHDPDVP